MHNYITLFYFPNTVLKVQGITVYRNDLHYIIATPLLLSLCIHVIGAFSFASANNSFQVEGSLLDVALVLIHFHVFLFVSTVLLL